MLSDHKDILGVFMVIISIVAVIYSFYKLRDPKLDISMGNVEEINVSNGTCIPGVYRHRSSGVDVYVKRVADGFGYTDGEFWIAEELLETDFDYLGAPNYSK